MTRCVFLWSPPRCTSTAFELCIRQLPDVKCYHEPLLAPYYTGPSAPGADFLQLPSDPSKTFHAAFQDIQCSVQLNKFKAVFVKSMSIFMNDRHDMLLADWLREAHHTFLIRHPLRVALSFTKFCSDRGVEFAPGMMSFKPTYDIYQLVKENLPNPPIVINIDNGLLDPEGMMDKYCRATGLKYKPGMATEWESKFTLESLSPSPELCGNSHIAALNSTGLARSVSEKPLPSDENLPEFINKVVREEMLYYEKLSSITLI